MDQIHVLDWEFENPTDDRWLAVTLPHTPFRPDPQGGPHWQGVCRYRRAFQLSDLSADERVTLYFHGAMHTARIRVDDHLIAIHEGGYLPFEVEIGSVLQDGKPHFVTVELDNRDDPAIPPGKPLRELDFCFYGGLYREVELRRYPAIHLSDAATAGIPAGGGIRLRTLSLDSAKAVMEGHFHLRNRREAPASIRLEGSIRYRNEAIADFSTTATLPPKAEISLSATWTIPRPLRWSVASRHLYELEVTVNEKCSDEPLEKRCLRFGLRTVTFSRSEGLQLNGERIRPRGVNRHQDYPWTGYALPAHAQRQDAIRLKEAGFDYVRLSHYPQSPHFLDACDELGILVMNCLPGWQYLGDEKFRQNAYQAAREMIRRDRHHPSVVLWELSLNETEMDAEFMATMQRLGHEEMPGGEMITCGWMDTFDVFIHSRQHGRLHHWQNGDKALVVAEYGDWEYYASNEGFDQKSKRGLLDPRKNSRAFPRDGEARLRQQALNHAEALNDTLRSPAAMDGLWSLCDYPRGYEPERAACGVFDFFRRPKFSFHFYRSQRPPEETGNGWQGGPMVFLATYWQPGSDLEIMAFSNTEKVELYLDDRPLGEMRPDRARFPALPHPPLFFSLPQFSTGVLEARAFLGDKEVARHRVRTPETAWKLHIELDPTCGFIDTSEPNLYWICVEIFDQNDQRCVSETRPITLRNHSNLLLEGPDVLETEAGIASFLLRKELGPVTGRLDFEAENLRPIALDFDK